MSQPAGILRPALFLDRDGIINVDTDFLYRIEDVVFVDGILDLVRTARAARWAVVIVTNQSGIGRGYYTEEQFHTLMDWMCREMAAQGAAVDAVYFSPYHPKHGLGQYQRESDCRKPGPGMLLRAAEEQGLDLARSVMVGDRCSDMQAAAAAGVPKRFLLLGTVQECPGEVSYCPVMHLKEIIQVFEVFSK